jgi:hypothetical protein
MKNFALIVKNLLKLVRGVKPVTGGAKVSLVEQQKKFAMLLGKLLTWIYNHPSGFAVVIGEVKRTPEMQELYLKQGKTKVNHSKHQDSLAVDLALFIDGVYQTKSEDYVSLGAYWKSLDPGCVWGGDWKSFHDGNHFQYGV